MIAEFFDFFLSDASDFAPLIGLFLLAMLVLSGFVLAILLRPGVAGFGLGLLALALAYVVDFVLSAFIVISQNLEFDRFPAGVELVLYGLMAASWTAGAVIGALVARNRALLRAVGAQAREGALEGLRYARAHAKDATKFGALALLCAAAQLLTPFLALAIGECFRWFGYVALPACFLVLPFAVPAKIAAGRPFRAWTVGIALCLVFAAWWTSGLRAPVPPGQAQSVTDPRSDTFELIFIPAILAAPATALRWLRDGFRRIAGASG